MAIEVNLVLPDNLRSSFLRGDFLQQGDTYSVLLQNNNAGRDNNRHSLTLGFELVDTDTHLPVALTRIKSLKISNDPNFDVPSTLEITNWPAGTYDANTTYTYTFDPDYFFDPVNVTPQGTSDDPGVSPGDNPGFFIVENWPLSANGGLSTVYFQVVLLSGSEEVFYPGSYGIFDQIFWQTERPSTPGVPEPQTITDGWTGRKYQCKFRASEEPSTGRFSSGVSSYFGDILEIRRDDIVLNQYNIASTQGASLDDVKRSFMPSEPADSLTVTGYNVQYDNTGYAANVARTMDTVLLLDTSAVLRGAALYTDEQVLLSTNAPDFGVQAHVSMTLADVNVSGRYYLKAYTGTFDGTAPSVDELVVRVNIPSVVDIANNQNPTADIYRLSASYTPSSVYTVDLPMHIVPSLLSGGLLELYVSNFDEHNMMGVTAYFTPDYGTKESFVLARTLVANKFSDTAALGGAIVGATTGGDGTFRCKELAYCTGRFLLNLDLGDCFKDDTSQNLWLSSDTSLKNWSSLFANGEWIHYTEFVEDLVDTTRSESSVGPVKSGGGSDLTLSAPGYLNQKSVSEIQCAFPTMSSRAQVTFNVDANGSTSKGEFYVAFSSDPVTEQETILRPMVTRCDPYQMEASEPIFLPTIVVGFSPVRGIYVSHRDINNNLTTKKMLHYAPNPNTSEDWKVIISSEPSNGSGDTTSVVLLRNDEVVGHTLVGAVLDPRAYGLGFYTAIGVRSEKATDSESSADYASTYVFTDIKVEGLRPISAFGDDDPANTRHFAKYNTGATTVKPALGQYLIAGNTDPEGFSIENKPSRTVDSVDWEDYVILVDAVTVGENIGKTFDCPAGQLDLVETSLGGFDLYIGHLVLVKDQTDPIENGIYEVKYDAGTSQYYWERWSGMAESDIITTSDENKIYVRMRERWEWAQNCRVASTTAVPDFNAVPTTIDGVDVKVGDRILICNESTNFYRQGIYVVSSINAGGATCVITRASDLNTSAELTPRIRVKVELGATYANTYWGFKMLAAAPPSIPYTIDTTDIHIHRQPFNTVLEPCRYASNVNLTLSGLVVGPYTLTAGDRILIKSQTNQVENGIYIAAAGAWTRATDFDASSDVFPHMSIPVKDGVVNKITRWTIDPTIHDSLLVGTINMRFVKIPNLEGTTWYLKTDEDIEVGVNNIEFLSADYAQVFETNDIGLNTSYTGELVELKCKSFVWGHSPSVRLHLHDASTGRIGPPLTDWVPSTRRLLESFQEHGMFASRNDLVQFDLNSMPLYLDSGRTYWLVVRPPAGSALCTANAGHLNFEDTIDTGEFKGLNLSNVIYYKIYARSFERYNNVKHLSAIHSRVLADSHARFHGNASPLSEQVIVDITAPTSASVPNRPFVQPTIKPSVRSAVLDIEAEDTDSGLLAFRVGRESHYGMMEYTCWQPWSAYTNAGATQYTTYLYGTWWKNSLGTPNTLFDDFTSHTALGSTSDGSRKVWVQVMDKVGNISESYPITLLAQGLALVDTTSPTGTLQFVDNLTGTQSTITNKTNSLVLANGEDRVSAVKDLRFRALKAGTARDWSTWRSYAEYIKWRIDNDLDSVPDGLKRLEAQFRDYGNNIEPESPLWDSIFDSATKGVIFNCMLPWTPIGATEETLYLSGIKSEDYVDLELQDSFSKDYPDNTAYYAVSTSPGSEGRQVRLRSSDNVIVYVNAAPTTDFTIDAVRGMIVFNSPTTPGDVLTADISRDYAVIYKWDGEAVLKVVDMSYFDEPAILSMCSTYDAAVEDVDNFMLLGGASGKVWKFNGTSVSGPVFIAAEGETSLPVTVLHLHKFSHEDDMHVYAGTAHFPRLFRAKAINADSPTAWDAVAQIGYLDGGVGDITCAASAYDMIFLGTNAGRILRYERTLINTTDNEELEALSESQLTNEYIGEYEGDILPVSCLLATQDQVLAGIGDRPEVWTFVLERKEQPYPPELWSQQIFNRWFINDSVPWQFYSTGEMNEDEDDVILNSSGRTHNRGNRAVVGESISTPDAENGYRDLIIIHSGAEGTQTEFVANTGSDWEQLVSKNAPSNTLQDVVAATTEALPFEPTYNNGTLGVGATLTASINGVLEIDGITFTTNDRILIKDQVNKAHNGIYTITQLGTVGQPYILTRAVDLDAAADFVINLYVAATSGTLNANNGWLLSDPDGMVVGTTDVIWLKPAWAMEFDMMHFAGGNQGFEVSDGYYVTNVSVSNSEITLSSGGKEKTLAFRPTDFQMMSIGSAKYPESNVKKIWNFTASDAEQDTGPYWTGDEADTVTGSADWNAYRFIIPNNTLIGQGKEEPETNATFTTKTQFVRVTPSYGYGYNTATGVNVNPRFGINNMPTAIAVDSNTKVYVRLRLTNNATSANVEPAVTAQDWSGVKIRFAWSESNFISENTRWYELDAVHSNGFELYVFDVAWNNQLRSLAIEVSGLQGGAQQPYIDVDYVALVSDDLQPNLTNNFVPVRVMVEGRDVKLWLGKSDEPLINEVNFLTLPTTQMEVRFGKIDPDAAISSWGWGYIKFVTGGTAEERLLWAPSKKIVHDFRLQNRFPSTGSVRCLVNYQGSAWALTEGVSEMRVADNPDDRAAKTFQYIAEHESWRMQDPPCPRETNGNGLIRPLSAVSYYGTLIVSGERGNIRFI